MENQSISYLKSKVWYRSLTVVWLFMFGLSLFICIAVWVSDDFKYTGEVLLWGAGIVTFFETIRRATYYIALGTINPEE